ncbi:MAG: DUF1549 domain-containing protein, partial [Planctomycetaceae bacterium]|nr:DUF1549 domain-containing protein [Planctomycetaceae bacterium]
MNLILALLLLVQAQDRDPVLEAVMVDGAAKGIPGAHGAAWLPPVGDEAFLRRVTKDLVDAAPSEAELQAFVADPDPKKRSKKIDRLVADDRFATSWAKRFEGVFFVDVVKNPWTGVPDLAAEERQKIVDAFTSWLAKKLRDDKPWTDIVGQMLDARGTPEGDPALGYLLSFRRGMGFEREFVENMPRQLLGIRLRCARCHDHPFDKWRVEDYYGMASFVVRQRARFGKAGLEVKYDDSSEMAIPRLNGAKDADVKLASGGDAQPNFLFGGTAGKNDDRMKTLVGFMTVRANSQLPRMLANRVWGWLLGSGVVHPVDDFSLKNKAVSPALLELLTRSVIDGNYSVKHLVRVICNTESYQQPLPEEAPEGEGFRRIMVRKLAPRVYPPGAKAPEPPVTFEPPAGWTPIRRAGPAKLLLGLPSPGVELGLFEGRLDESQWTNQTGKLEPRKSAVSTLEGKGGLKITLTELSGTNWCLPKADGPVEYRFWLAELAAPK